MRRTTSSVDVHLASLEGSAGDEVRLLDFEISRRMPPGERHLYEGKFWGGTDQHIVGYGLMDRVNRSGEQVQWFTVGLAAQKNYISIYVNAVKDGEYLLRQYERRLGKAKVGAASIGFKSLHDVDQDALMQLVEEAALLT